MKSSSFKHLTLSVLLAFICSVFDLRAEVKLISEDKVWDYIHYVPNYETKTDYMYFEQIHWLMQFKGTKVINGREYHQIYCSEDDKPIDFEQSPLAYMREDYGRIYMIRDSSAYDRFGDIFSFGYADKEFLIYDFNLEVGEMLDYSDWYNVAPFTPHKCVVDSIGYTFIDGKQATAHYISAYYIPELTSDPSKWHAIYGPDIAIEGVGTVRFGLLPFPYIKNLITSPWRDDIGLYQVRTTDGKVLYTNTEVPQLVRLISEDKVWEYIHKHNVYDEVTGDYCTKYDHHLMAFRGTKMINGVKYHKLYYSEANADIDFEQSPVAYMREGPGTVYMLSDSSALERIGKTFSALCLSEEELIYDFSIRPDKTHDMYETDEIDHRFATRWKVDSVEETTIDDRACNKQHVSIHYMDSPNQSKWPYSNELAIEGIGSVNSGLLPFPYIHDRSRDTDPELMFLHEVRTTDGRVLYSNPTVSIGNVQSDEASMLTLTGTMLKIASEHPWQLEVITPSGTRMMHCSGNNATSVATDELSPGIYIAVLNCNGGTQAIKFAR